MSRLNPEIGLKMSKSRKKSTKEEIYNTVKIVRSPSCILLVDYSKLLIAASAG
jgi:hypothetical protein